MRLLCDGLLLWENSLQVNRQRVRRVIQRRATDVSFAVILEIIGRCFNRFTNPRFLQAFHRQSDHQEFQQVAVAGHAFVEVLLVVSPTKEVG